MVELPARKLGQEFTLGPLPSYTSAQDILRTSISSLAPTSRQPVSEAAQEYMKVNANGRWVDFDPSTTPYAVEPANMLSSRRYREWILAGPARAGKTVILLQGVAHGIVCDPGVTHIVQMTDRAAELWVDEELTPMIENSPALAKRQGMGVSDRNKISKKFIGGAKLTIGVPTVSGLANRTIRSIYLTDYDRFKLSVGGEGAPFYVAAKRTEIAKSRGMAAAESSPGHEIMDPDWTPKTIHEAPPCAGILDLYNGGTRGRWYWDCLDCGEAYEPRFDLLQYDKKASPFDAGEQAEMKCPHCKALLGFRHRNEVNRKGYWLHETAEGGVARIESGDVLRSMRVSYWLNGTAAAFTTWSRLVEKYETALRAFKKTADDEALKVTINTDQGLPYLSRVALDQDHLTESGLKAKARVYPQGVVPSWGRFVVTTVDVQKGKFVVQVMAFGVDGQRIPIDRFDLHTPPADAPRSGERTLDPASYLEDWEVLRELLTRAYPVEGEEYALNAMAVCCDFHGEPGVSDNATKFWQKRRSEGEAQRFYMVRGHGGSKTADRVWYSAPTRKSDGKKARDIKLLNIATDKLKTTVYAALNRPDGGPGSQLVPAWMAQEHVLEFTAEQLTKTGWKKRPNMLRNEAFDLSGYAQAYAEFKGLNRLRPDALPSWAAHGLTNDFAVPLEVAGEETPIKASAPPMRRRKIKYLE
ncbi:phage terminase large subunit family protein [Falsihalocynthiibacter sp. CO-5D18]|uniref:phage terminase large subunit family protein n=1 Tax=Falsihalocynthiibacter sp. CO-5D18 TaxID=3240872 RepID=UPI00350FF9DD